MVFNIDTLNERQKNKDTLSLLESLPYIERQFVDPTPTSIPLVELADMKDVHFVRYSDLEQLASVYDISIQEAAREVQDANFLSSHRFVVAMEEWRPLLDPGLIDAFPNVLLIKEVNTPTYRFCETCMNYFMETHDVEFVNIFLEDSSVDAQKAKLNQIQTQIGKLEDELWSTPQNDPKFKAINMQLDYQRKNLKANQAKLVSLEDQAKAAEAQKQQTSAQPASPSSKTAPLQQSQPTQQQQPEQQGWWARKWAAFRNWMDSLGNNGDQKSTWFTNMTNKVKSFFNGGAQATQTANQQQGQSTQNANQQDKAAKANTQSTQNSKDSNRSIVSDTLVDMAAGKGMELGGRAIDNVVGKVNDFAADNFGVDLSDVTGFAGEVGKQIMNRKIGQGAEVVKDRGGEVVHDVVNKAKEIGKQGYQAVKNAVTKPTNEGKTTVTTREVSEDEVPTWAKNKIG